MNDTPAPHVPRDTTVPTAGDFVAQLRSDAGATGDAAIDQALNTVRALDDGDVGQHPAVFEQVHRVLRDALAGAAAPPDEGSQVRS